MLSLGPGSACDVCLEPFGTDLKAPCSIPCGHVFCVSCLHNVARPTCPLCRTSFSSWDIIKLHIDLESIAAALSVEQMPVPSNTQEHARQLQNRITQVAQSGATELQTTQLTEECKVFLAPLPKTMYTDLRTAYKMLHYMCNVKHLYIEQGRTLNQHLRNITTLTQEVDRLKAGFEALKIEKRRLEEAWQTVSAERDNVASECEKLHEQLDNAEAQMLLVTEQNETAQNQLVLLHEELQRLRSAEEFSSPEGDSFPPELPPSMTSDPYWPPPTLNVEADADTEDSAQPFLTPWEHLTDPKALPDADLPQDPEPSPLESMPSNGGYCGAAGCPHSCNCMPFLLFSPASRAAAAASMGARLSTSDGRSMSDVFGAPGGPSSLSLSLTQHRDRSRSRSHSRPRSRSLSRAPSPVNPIILHPPSASPLPSMSASIPVPNPELRGLLEDPPSLQNPPMSSSLPNMAPSRFLSPFPSSPLSREFRDPLSSKDRSAPLTSSSKPRETQLHPPMLSHSRNPSPYPSTAPLADPAASQRPPLYRTPSGSSSRAVDEAQRSDRERRRAERSSTSRSSPLLMAEAASVPMLRPQSHGLSIPPSSSIHASPAPPMPRPYGTQPSSLRLPSPLLIPPAEGMSRAHASLTPLPSPSIPVPSKAHHAQPPAYPTPLPRPQAYTTPHPPMAIPNQPTVHQPSAPPMPRPQAHALPPSATTASSSRPSTKPTSSALQPTPAAYEYPGSAAAPTTRSAPDGPGPRSERVRRSDATNAPRGGYGGVTRGTSKHIPTAPTMTTPPSLLFT